MATNVIAEPVVTSSVVIVDNVTQSVVAVPDAVVTYAPPIQDTWMKFNPYFDWSPLLNIPLWAFISAFFLFVLFVVFAYWMVRLKRMQAVKGYVDVMKTAGLDDVMVWVISTVKSLTIECLVKRDTVLSFKEPTRVSKWVHDSPPSVVHIGGCGGVIVSEDYYKTRDMVSEMALTYNCDEFNRNQESLLNDSSKDAMPPISNYHDYETFGRQVLETLHPDGLPLPSYSIFDPDKFRRYFPKRYTAAFSGGIFIRDARELNLGIRVPNFWEKVLPIGFISAAVMVFVVAAWMVPLGA